MPRPSRDILQALYHMALLQRHSVFLGHHNPCAQSKRECRRTFCNAKRVERSEEEARDKSQTVKGDYLL